jgi:hypothetical protein
MDIFSMLLPENRYAMQNYSIFRIKFSGYSGIFNALTLKLRALCHDRTRGAFTAKT